MGDNRLSPEQKQAQKEGHAIQVFGEYIEMPQGAACERLHRHEFVKVEPQYLRELLEAHGAQKLYEAFVMAIDATPRTFFGYIAEDEAFKAGERFYQQFKEKNIELHCCRKVKTIYHPDGKTSQEKRVWIVYVDMKALPDYTPKHKWDGHHSCCVM